MDSGGSGDFSNPILVDEEKVRYHPAQHTEAPIGHQRASFRRIGALEFRDHYTRPRRGEVRRFQNRQVEALQVHRQQRRVGPATAFFDDPCDCPDREVDHLLDGMTVGPGRYNCFRKSIEAAPLREPIERPSALLGAYSDVDRQIVRPRLSESLHEMRIGFNIHAT